VLLESGPDAAKELRALLRLPLAPKQRWLIIVVLGELRALDAVDELMGCLEDPDDELSARACHARGKIGDPDSSAALAAICTDGRRPWFVRTAAAGACGQTGDPWVAEALVEALDSEEWYPRNAAAASLVKLGDVGLAAVCRRIGEPDPDSTLHYWGLLDAANRPNGSSCGPRRASAACDASWPRPGGPAPPPGWRRWPTTDRKQGATPPCCSRATRWRPACSRPWRPDVVRDALLGINQIVLVYFIVIVTSYSAVTLLSWVQVRRYFRRLVHARLKRSVRSSLTPPISICVPAYNEASVIVDSVRSMLALPYAEHEVVLTNDGSTDDTLELLAEAFDMHRVDQPQHPRLPTQRVRGVWRSRSDSGLIVIDKENGGRADALNASINFARYPLVCCVDADSLLERDALLTVVRPFIERPDRTIGAGRIIRVANGCEITRGHVTAVGLPRKVLPMFQTVEYLRAFTAARTGWSMINGLLIISGAFGLFRKDAVIDAGGFAADSRSPSSSRSSSWAPSSRSPAISPSPSASGSATSTSRERSPSSRWRCSPASACRCRRCCWRTWPSGGSVEWRDFRRLVSFSMLENFGSRQLTTIYRVRGFWSYVRGNHSWGHIDRTSFTSDGLAPDVGGH
jgi:Glycosyl transferase family 2/HEAT repeats